MDRYKIPAWADPRHWSLTVRLTVLMILLVVISLAGVTLITIQAVRTTLTEQIGNNFEVQTIVLNDLTRLFLREKTSQLQTLALTEIVQNEVTARNLSYSGSSEEILAEIQALDTTWREAADDDPLVVRLSSTDRTVNPAAHQLAAFLDVFTDHTEVFITDRYGATIGTSGHLTDYYQADEAWWQAAWNDGQGAVFISNPEFDQSAGVTALLLAVPIISDESGEAIGVLRSTLNVDALYRLIAAKTFGRTGRALLLDETGQVLFDPLAPEAEDPGRFTEDLQEHIFGHPPGFMSMVWPDQEGDPAMIGHAHLDQGDFQERSIIPAEKEVDEAVGNLQWVAVVQQKADEAFASVDQVVQISLVTGLIAVGLATVVAVVVARTITRPLLILGTAAEQIGAGHLDTRLPEASGDEIGRLTRSFGQMAGQLQDSFAELETRSHQRVRDLEVAAEISRQLTTVLDADELLRQVVNSIQAAFGYYHVHVYLIDKNTGELMMREGSGEVGRQLKSKGHKLQPGQGIVGTVAQSGEAFLTENVADVPNFVRNPLLPETQAELAVPLRKGRDMLGVLDLQSQALAEFGQEELTLMQSIADQLAVALENARLFEDARVKAAEAERLSRRLTREVWQALGSETLATGYTFTKSGIRSGSSGWLPAMDQALQRQNLVQYTDDDNGGGREENNTSVAIPLRLRGEVIGAIGIERPAERVWTEDELSTVRTVTDQISRALENARLSKEQEKTIVQLKEVDRLKSEFLTSMSHELRTPLNSIIGFADVLLQGIDGELNELALNDIQLIYNSGQHLLALINDILDISKIEAGMMELICEPIDIEETVNDVLAASASLVKERSVEIVVDIEADAQSVFADKLRLNQVLLNLVSNAAKFTHAGTITIQARVDDRSPDKMRIAVIDTGIGIPPEQMGSIFDRFRQADSSTTREYGGTGLGLAICRQLVEMHGGSLDVESEEGVGSEFCFTIPLAKYKLGGAPSASSQGD